MFVEYDVENDKKVISELIVIIGFICMISFEVKIYSFYFYLYE